METPLYEQIFNHLLQKIKEGELRAGDRVPSEKELAEQFRVSRITSKKALELLSQHKLVDRIQGKGSFVSEALSETGKLESLLHEERMVDKKTEEKTIGVILPDFGDSFGAEILRGIEEQCSRHGGHMLMKLTYDRQETEAESIRSFVKLGVDGLIVFPVHGEHYNSELVRLVLDRYPVVLIDRYLKGIAATAVMTDNRRAAFDAFRLLQRGGKRPVGFLSSPPDHTATIEDRLEGFTEACQQELGTPLREHLLINLHSTLPQTFEEAKANVGDDLAKIRLFVESHPELTAFLVTEYGLSLLLQEVLISMGKAIPDDCEIVSFDSPSRMDGMYPFTHVKQNERGIGRKAAELVLASSPESNRPMNHLVDYELILGQSTRNS